MIAEHIAFETDAVVAWFGGHRVQSVNGRDILERCLLTYNGPEGRFILNIPPEQE